MPDTQKVREALSFAKSAILCGEQWTDECERMIGGALAALDSEQGEGEGVPVGSGIGIGSHTLTKMNDGSWLIGADRFPQPGIVAALDGLWHLIHRSTPDRLTVLAEAAREVLNYGIELDDSRLDYIVVQVPREAIRGLKAALKQAEVE